MRAALVLAAATTLAFASCASDDAQTDDAQTDDAQTEGAPADDGSSVSIITTTTTEPPAADTIEPSATTDMNAPSDTIGPEGATSTSEPATTIVITSPTTSTTTTATTATVPTVVGDPVVSSEIVGQFIVPIDLAVRPGDQHWYVVEQRRGVARFDGAESVTVLDLSDRISGGGEQGVLGLAFSPDGARAFVNFTDRSGATNIVEYSVNDAGQFDESSERTVLTVDQPFENHNAGDLEFGPDGMLYITLGDGGSGGDPERNSSDPFTLLGSLLRIDPDPSGDAAYTIPSDNPFADGSGGAPEVWSFGLRNPWKIAFDPVTAELWIPDVGQNAFEEVNVVGPADGHTAGRGVDFGWSAYEGTERFNTDVDDPGTLTSPVLTYGRADGCSVTGGVPYRGSAIPELESAFVYSDFCGGRIWALDLAGSRNLTLLDGFKRVTAVRTGPDGEIYVLDSFTGSMHRLVPG